MKKIIALGLSVLMCVSILTACGGNKDNVAKDGKTKLTVGIWDDKQRPTMENLIQAYQKEHENVDIEVQLTPYKGGEYWTKLEASATGGTAPDVFWINVLHAEAYNDGGILKDLTEASKELDLASNYPEALVKAYTFDDKLIAIPKDFDTNALWYNKDIFDQANVPYPTDDWTFDDLVATARQLKEAGLSEGVYPFACPVDFQTWYYPTVFAAGGYILNEDKTATGYEDAKTQQGIQCWIDLINEGLSPSAASLAETTPDTFFSGGQLAMNLAGSYMTAEYTSNEMLQGKIDLVEFPAFNGVEPNVINGLGYAVYEGTKNAEEAISFAIWLGSAEAMKIQGEAGAVISARNDAQHYFAETRSDINLSAYTNHSDIANPLPVCKSAAELYDLELSKLKLAYAGERTLEDVCKELKSEADALLQKSN